ncbi:hypothetical protein, partial [Serratia marcescens]|uniref:hypothetical protein n=1 Tax=Serratia marcescens TaxID=615 RepID=UPI0028136438
MSLTEALRLLSEKRLIKPLEKPTDGKPIGMRMDQWCDYHQVKGHHTDFCRSLRSKVQDLIDEGKIPKPNVTTNPLPRHDVHVVTLEVEEPCMASPAEEI